MRRQKSFLLKLWNDSTDDEMWRASLEDLKSQEKRHFSTIEQLLSFLDKKNSENTTTEKQI